MGRSEPPFLYDPPPKDAFQPTPLGNFFNRGAVTEENWAPMPARPARQQKSAPLINFNRHPDSVSL